MASGLLAHRPATGAVVTGRARVALLTTFYHPVVGGAEMAARRLAIFLKERGHEVFVLTKRTDAALPPIETIDGVSVERLGRAAERRGIGKWTIIPRALAALLRRRDDYDVICVIDYRGVGLAAIVAGKMLNRPVIVQAQTEGVLSCTNWAPLLKRVGLAPENPLARALSWPLRRAYRTADAFACISRTIQTEAVAEGVPARRVHYLPNTVDTNRFRPAQEAERLTLRERAGWPADSIVAIFVGRLSREKGVMDLLRAWEQVRTKTLLALVGPDMPGHPWDEGPRARAAAASPPLAGRVMLLGPSNDTAPLYRAADLAVVPSHWESFGISAVEAMATSLPVVASAVGGLTDYLVDDENGLLVPAQDPAAIATAVDRLSSDASLRVRLGQAARRTAEQFDERVVLNKFGSLIDSLAGSA